MQNKINIEYFKTPMGELILGSYENKLCLTDWRYRKMRNAIDKRIQTALNAEYFEEASEIIDETKTQLNHYFNSERKEFDISLMMIGSEFQKGVWKALQQIPYGQTASYLSLAKTLNKEKAVRAVASANGANAISILIPCHRIIGSNGSLVGYAGGLNAKKKLLMLENTLIESQLELFSN